MISDVIDSYSCFLLSNENTICRKYEHFHGEQPIFMLHISIFLQKCQWESYLVSNCLCAMGNSNGCGLIAIEPPE